MPGSTYRSRFVFLFWLQMIIRHPPGKFSPCFLHLLMAQVASNNIWEENWAKVFLVLRYEGRRTKQDSDQACFKHKTSIPDQHRLFLDNFLIIKYFYQLWEHSGAIFMLHKLSEDTFIRSQSLPRNTTFQALSNPERKLENNVSIQAIGQLWAPKWNWTVSYRKWNQDQNNRKFKKNAGK